MPDKKELKDKYQRDIQIVRRLVNQFDPCGFIHFYNATEEYDDMNNQILNYVYDHKTRQQIREMILDKVQNYYGWPDLTIMKEPHKTEFYNDLEKLLDDLYKELSARH